MAYNQLQKLKGNIAAIRIALEWENGKTLETDDIIALQQYAGFGGLKAILFPAGELEEWIRLGASEADQKLYPAFMELHQLLKRYLTDSEYKESIQSLKNSVLTSFYTPGFVPETIYESLKENNIHPRRIYEPSSGAGIFITEAAKAFTSIEQITAVEKDLLSGKILAALSASLAIPVNIHITGLEQAPVNDNGQYDLAISNIPFGNFSVYDPDIQYGGDDYNISELNYEFATEYVFWLRAFKNCANNSVIKYVSNLKKIIIECVRKGWIKSDPFIELRLTKDDVVKVAITKDELNRISNKTFITDRLNNVRDIFLFSCYTGLAYVDISNLRRSQIIKGIDDIPWINIQRQKTGTPSRLTLLPIALDIMNKYKNHPKCSSENLVLPVLTNQKMNAYLKEIADICGITTNLTFHIARHTFATTITLNNGVPIETVSKMLGHKSLQQTQHYAKILDGKVSEDMIRLRKKLGSV